MTKCLETRREQCRAKDNGRSRIEIASIALILDRVKRASAAAERAAGAKAAAKFAA